MKKRGFTLIELMIVVAIIGILAAVAIPKFADLIRKSNEGATKGNLGAIKSSLAIYYGDHEGVYPDDPSSLTLGGAYLAAIPISKTPPYHAEASTFLLVTGPPELDDSGAWAYVNQTTAQFYGTVVVNCTDTDSKGSIWANY